MRDDDEDLLLERTTRALSRCTDAKCAAAAVVNEGFGSAYARALPGFITGEWARRAPVAFIGIEASHAMLEAIGPPADGVFTRAALDLGVTWPDRPVAIDVVSEAPQPSTRALAPVLLATRGRCFVRDDGAKGPPGSVEGARILDCLLVHALLAAAHESDELAGPLHRAIVRELGEHDGERAWSLLVIHAAAVTVTAWEPKHRSVYRRSAEAVEGPMLEWLARERRAGAESFDAFAARYAARWRAAREP